MPQGQALRSRAYGADRHRVRLGRQVARRRLCSAMPLVAAAALSLFSFRLIAIGSRRLEIGLVGRVGVVSLILLISFVVDTAFRLSRPMMYVDRDFVFVAGNTVAVGVALTALVLGLRIPVRRGLFYAILAVGWFYSGYNIAAGLREMLYEMAATPAAAEAPERR